MRVNPPIPFPTKQSYTREVEKLEIEIEYNENQETFSFTKNQSYTRKVEKLEIEVKYNESQETYVTVSSTKRIQYVISCNYRKLSVLCPQQESNPK